MLPKLVEHRRFHGNSGLLSVPPATRRTVHLISRAMEKAERLPFSSIDLDPSRTFFLG
jgi:hypothetical protein